MGRAEPLPRVLCKGEGLPRERSSAGDGVAIIPRCVVGMVRPAGASRKSVQIGAHSDLTLATVVVGLVGGLGQPAEVRWKAGVAHPLPPP